MSREAFEAFETYVSRLRNLATYPTEDTGSYIMGVEYSTAMKLFMDGYQAAEPKWIPIGGLDTETDDLFWFRRGDTFDGPRSPQAGGYDADEWDYFAPCEPPPFVPEVSND